MGIVNITDDSFSGDGSLQIERAIGIARNHVTAGADIIDLGGESARTNRTEISAEEESARVLPFLGRFEECYEGNRPIDEMQIFPPLLSINTWRSKVARLTLRVGGHLLNDMSALATNENARIAAMYGAGLVIMHSIGLPKQRHTHILYADILRILDDFFDLQINRAMAAGVAREAIVLDPGIDFAKQKMDNLRIYRELKSVQRFDRPILLPVSRKTVIGDVLGIAEPSDRDAGTIACVVAGTLRGASIFRVHNVRAVVQALRTIYPIVNGPSDLLGTTGVLT
ncbi:MAG: dihydropteroate synthase [Verrucomicrobia bacterium]|nr:dihydropteroate synthase [Verrucomicrobiota bacterium]